MYKKISLMLMLVFLLLFLTSCVKNNDNSTSPNNVINLSENNIEYNLTSDKIIDSEKIMCKELIDSYNDGYVFTGNASYSNSELLVLSQKSGSSLDKKKFNLDLSTNDVISVKKKDDVIYFLCGKEGKGSIIAFDQNFVQIEKKNLDYYPIDFDIKDKVYILNSSEIEVYTDTLLLETSVDISYMSNDVRLYPSKIAAASQSEIYCIVKEINNNSTVQLMSITNEKKSCIKINDMERVDDVWVNTQGNIIIAGIENQNCMIDELDKNGNIVNMFEINDCDVIHSISNSDKIIYSNSKGIASFENGETELIIRFENIEGKDILTCFTDVDECIVYLSDSFENYNAVFITDKNNNIISEIKVESLSSCFVQNNKIYINGFFEGKRTIIIYDNEEIISTGIELDDDRYSYNIGVLPSGEIIIAKSNSDELLVYSDTFEFIDSISTNIFITDFFKNTNSLFCYDKENIYIFNTNYKLEKLEIGFGQLGNNISFSSGNMEYDLLLADDNKIWGYNIEKNSFVELINYNKDLLTDIISFLILEDNRIIINNLWNIYEYKTYEISTDNLQQKQKLILAFDEQGQGINLLKKAVNSFNSKSKQFEIEMKGYPSDENGTASTLLALDLASGKIPDIIMTNLLSENIITFLKNNTLTDMNQFMEKDDVINQKLFYSSILDAFTYDGKLYSLPLTYEIWTGRTSYDEVIKNQMLKENINYISETYNSDKYLVERLYMNNLTEILLADKLDFAQNSNNLTESDLKTLISFFRNYDNILNYQENYDAQQKNILVNGVFIDTMESYYHNLLCNTSGVISDDTGEYSDIGCLDAAGIINPGICFSIVDKCENKEAVWEFIKTCFETLESDNSTYECGLYSNIELNTGSSISSNIPAHVMEKFNAWIERKCINHILYSKLDELICNEITMNPDISDEELSTIIYNKIKLYLFEIE